MSLFEKYRPKDLESVVAQPKAVALLRRLIDGKTLCGRAILLTGGTGTGKTTLARIASLRGVLTRIESGVLL